MDKARVLAVFWVSILTVSYLALITPLPLLIVDCYTLKDIHVPALLSKWDNTFYLAVFVAGIILIVLRVAFRAQLNRGFIWVELRIPRGVKGSLAVVLAVILYVGITSITLLGMIGYIYSGFIYSLVVAEAKLGTFEDCFEMGKIQIEAISGTCCILALQSQGFYASALAFALIVAVASLAGGHILPETRCWVLVIEPSPIPNAESLIRFLNKCPAESDLLLELAARASADITNFTNSQAVQDKFRVELVILKSDMKAINEGIRLNRIARMRRTALKIQEFVEKQRRNEEAPNS